MEEVATGNGNRNEAKPGEFAHLVRQWRETRNMSQERLAHLAGISPGYVSLLETGRRGQRPSRDTIVGIAQALNAPIQDFLVAAGRADTGARAGEGRPSFAEFVQGDHLLKSTQKRMLIDLYESWTGSVSRRKDT